MSVVTMTGHLGSMGSIARETARALGYHVMDRELALEAAGALGWDETEVQAFDERTSGQGSRLMRLLQSFVERSGTGGAEGMLAGGAVEAVMIRTYGDTASPTMLPDDERYIEQLHHLIRSLAEQGDIVLVGRGAQAILADDADTVHVRVACLPEERIRRIAARDEMTLEDATKRVTDSDTQREAWHRKYFDLDYRAAYHYHLMVNSGQLSDEQATALVVEAVRQLAPGS